MQCTAPWLPIIGISHTAGVHSVARPCGRVLRCRPPSSLGVERAYALRVEARQHVAVLSVTAYSCTRGCTDYTSRVRPRGTPSRDVVSVFLDYYVFHTVYMQTASQRHSFRVTYSIVARQRTGFRHASSFSDLTRLCDSSWPASQRSIVRLG